MIIGTALIVCTWLFFVNMGLFTWAAICITVLGGIFIFFGLLFVVYFFNLDMKLLAALQPLLGKVYDKRKRTKQI